MGKTYSIMTTNMNKCFVCGCYSNIEIHHIFGGPNRKHSTTYGLVVPLCKAHHTGGYFGNKEAVHYNKTFMDELHAAGQTVFEEHYPELSFIEIFGKNYK